MKSVQGAARLCSCWCQPVLWLLGDFLSLSICGLCSLPAGNKVQLLIISIMGVSRCVGTGGQQEGTDKLDWYARTRTKGNQDPWPGTRPRLASRSQQLESVDVQWGSNQQTTAKMKIYMLWPVLFKASPALHSFSLPYHFRCSDPASSPLGARYDPRSLWSTPTSVASLPISVPLHPSRWPARRSSTSSWERIWLAQSCTLSCLLDTVVRWPTRPISSAQCCQVTWYKGCLRPYGCGCGWSYIWPACWGLRGGLREGMTIVIGPWGLPLLLARLE